MKKTAFVWIMTAVLFAGCSKEEECAASGTEGVRALTAVLDESGTRAAFGQEVAGTMTVNWTEGDEIATCVDGVKYVYRLEGPGGTPTGTFVLVGDKAPASVSEVYYPASAVDETGTIGLRADQWYAYDSFDPAACVLKSEVVDGVASSFRGEYAVLGLRLTGSGQPLWYVNVSSEGGASVSLRCPYMPLGEEPVDLYIVFPAGEHILTFKVITADDRGTMTKTPAGAKTLVAGTLHRLPELAFVPDAELTWKIGDYYRLDGKEGIVFAVSEDGRHGKIVAMQDARMGEKMAWSTGTGTVGAGDQYDGVANRDALATFLANNPDLSWENYPAFSACGLDDWYLPARHEARAYSGAYPAVHDVVQRSLVQHKGTALHTEKGVAYWTSTEDTSDNKVYCAYMNTGTSVTTGKSDSWYVRPVAAF